MKSSKTNDAQSAPFADYVMRNLGSPLDVLAHFFPDAIDAAAAVGASLPTMPELDGARHYLCDLQGRKRSKHFYVGNLQQDPDGTIWPCVTFGTYRSTGRTFFWKPRNLAYHQFKSRGGDSTALSEANRTEYARRAAAILTEQNKRGEIRSANADKGRQAAAEVANSIWRSATPCSTHRYLTSKKVRSHGLRFAEYPQLESLWDAQEQVWRRYTVTRKYDLLIPLYDAAGKLWNIQRIEQASVDGKHSRYYLLGGRARTLSYRIGGEGPAWLVEGYATGATVHEATGSPVIVAFSADNLASVATELSGQIRGVAADNDANQVGKRAAEKTGLPYVMPPEIGDWNDYAAAHGLESVRELFGSLNAG